MIVAIGYDPFISSSRVQALDRAITELGREIRASRAARVDAAWRKAWNGFVRRWQIERDSYASWGDRLSPIEGGKRLDAFGNNYLWWAASFEERTGASVAPVRPEPAHDLSNDVGDFVSDVVPTPVWLIAGAAALAYVLTRRRSP